MPNRPAAELALGPDQVDRPDPDLEALPEPRRPGRTLTLVTMAATTLFSLAMVFALRGEAAYALHEGAPVELGNLTELELRPELANAWVHGDGLLSGVRAIRYQRPLDGRDYGYRLAPIAGNERIWVQVNVPEGMEGPRFVPPTSFVGRLIPMSKAGIRHSGLPGAAESAKIGKLPESAWLLVDGESPATTRWALGLIALFLGFAAFNVWGLTRLLRPAR